MNLAAREQLRNEFNYKEVGISQNVELSRMEVHGLWKSELQVPWSWIAGMLAISAGSRSTCRCSFVLTTMRDEIPQLRSLAKVNPFSECPRFHYIVRLCGTDRRFPPFKHFEQSSYLLFSRLTTHQQRHQRIPLSPPRRWAKRLQKSKSQTY